MNLEKIINEVTNEFCKDGQDLPLDEELILLLSDTLSAEHIETIRSIVDKKTDMLLHNQIYSTIPMIEFEPIDEYTTPDDWIDANIRTYVYLELGKIK